MSDNEEESCNPNKVCKNMEHVHYGYTQKGWIEELKKDGKWRE